MEPDVIRRCIPVLHLGNLGRFLEYHFSIKRSGDFLPSWQRIGEGHHREEPHSPRYYFVKSKFKSELPIINYELTFGLKL